MFSQLKIIKRLRILGGLVGFGSLCFIGYNSYHVPINCFISNKVHQNNLNIYAQGIKMHHPYSNTTHEHVPEYFMFEKYIANNKKITVEILYENCYSDLEIRSLITDEISKYTDSELLAKNTHRTMQKNLDHYKILIVQIKILDISN
jgi:hypothetical protein